MATECDVLVIGAGPGGGAAALHAARAGLSVILIEDHSEIGTPVHCGECLSLLATQNLGLEIPEEVISLDCKGIRIIFPDGSKKMLSEPGFVLIMAECGWPVAGGSLQVSFVSGHYTLSMGLMTCEGVRGQDCRY